MKIPLTILVGILGLAMVGFILVMQPEKPFLGNKNNQANKDCGSQENFDVFEDTIWEKSNKTLGRTLLKSENISIAEGMLKIIMPGNKLEGGEIATIEKLGYGTYEIRMKIPDAPSSITGFFLYAPPDYYYEIDIEIHNQPDGKLLLTTYANGAVQNECVGELGFDPTGSFHNYRFDYEENRVAFYVDNHFIKEWTNGFPKGQPMELTVNTWYPNWLEGTPATVDQTLWVDWIRY